MALASKVSAILRSDPLRWHLLGLVSGLGLPDCWIAAGFVRNAVWDHLHGRAVSAPKSDVDVIWYDPRCMNPDIDRTHAARLQSLFPSLRWSVKNQARMHLRNGDEPYRSAVDAMRYWPETATAVAARRSAPQLCEIASPLGLDDLFTLILRPTSSFRITKREIFEQRLRSKQWERNWPLLSRA